MYKYPHISCGYVGEYAENATVTSAYFFEIITDFSLLDNLNHFPQRIPKTGYFLELAKLEGDHYHEKFHTIVKQIQTNLVQALKNTVLHPRTAINYLRLMLRYSLFEDILLIEIPKPIAPELLLEIKFIQEIAKLEIKLSRDEHDLNLDGLLSIANEQLAYSILQKEVSISVINRIIVFACRHKAKIDNEILKKLLDTHIQEINDYDSNNFNAAILKSIAYRGIAMMNHLSLSNQDEYLLLAEQYARSEEGVSKIEHLIKKDNLYTCIQTMAKWHMHHQDFIKAEKYLRELCDLDPTDSVGHSELGLLLFRLERFSDAATCFYQAAKLGPPAVGMNVYFRAKCLEKIGLEHEAVSLLHEASNLDEEAISPLLDLFLYYQNNDDDKAKAIAHKIMSSSIFVDQLEEDELTDLQNILKGQFIKVLYERQPTN